MDNKDEINKKDFHVINLTKKINSFLSEDKPADVLIIKAHLLCEYYINHLLILNQICTAKEVESQTFFQKMEKIRPIFNFKNDDEKITFDMMGRLNKLRNKVGHELSYSLSESDVDTLGYLQGRQYILDKYDVETDTERLRNIIISVVISIALFLISSIRIQKKKNETLNQSKD